MSVLEVHDLQVTYGRNSVGVERVDLRVERGELVALLGRNGSGKTTTLRAISGFASHENARVTRGAIRFDRRDVTRLPADARSRGGIGIVPELRKIFDGLTVAEHFSLLRRRAGADRLDAMLEMFPVLDERRGELAGYLSGGERQMLAITATMASSPRVLLIDELSLGLAPKTVDELLSKLEEIRTSWGVAILLVEQGVEKVLKVASRCYLMRNGEVALTATTDELRDSPALSRLMIGGGAEEAVA